MSMLDALLFGVRTILSGGVALPQRDKVNFTGPGVSVQDNPSEGRTDVTISGGGGDSSSDDVSNTSTVEGETVTEALNSLAGSIPSEDVGAYDVGGEMVTQYDDWDPSGWGTAAIAVIEAQENVTITGVVPSTQPKVVYFLGDGEVTFPHNSSESDASNQFECPNSSSITFAPGDIAHLYYSEGPALWIVTPLRHDIADSGGGGPSAYELAFDNDDLTDTGDGYVLNVPHNLNSSALVCQLYMTPGSPLPMGVAPIDGTNTSVYLVDNNTMIVAFAAPISGNWRIVVK